MTGGGRALCEERPRGGSAGEGIDYGGEEDDGSG